MIITKDRYPLFDVSYSLVQYYDSEGVAPMLAVRWDKL